jgi:DNA-binding NarL/FixJ family response regulator
MAEEKSKFIFFESWDRYLDTLEEDRDINYVNAVARAMIKYGLYGDCQTDDETIRRNVDAVCSDLMNSTKARYASAVAGGRTGGRPMQFDPEVAKQLRDQGLSHQEIADQMGCSKKTVQRKLGVLDDEDEI